MMYREFNESGELVRQGSDANMMIEDAMEIGGCVIDYESNFVGGCEWVFEEFIKGNTLEAVWKVGDDQIQIWRGGRNDYWAYFANGDCSVRGTMLDVMTEISAIYGRELIEEQVEEV